MNIILTEPQISLFLKRRFTPEELVKVVDDVRHVIEDEGIIDEIAIYDVIRQFIKSKKFSDIDEFGDEHSYWKSYLAYEKPLITYVKSKLS